MSVIRWKSFAAGRADSLCATCVWGTVRKGYRRQGITAALIAAAVRVAKRANAPALEAYPVDTTVPGHTRNLFLGVASVFAQHGFQVVVRRRPDRPVMRRVLNTSA